MMNENVIGKKKGSCISSDISVIVRNLVLEIVDQVIGKRWHF